MVQGLGIKIWNRAYVAVILLSAITAAASAQIPSDGYTNGGWRTKDGTPKLVIEFSGGLDTATGPTRRYQDHGWNFTSGSGYNFNRRWTLLGEYSFNHFLVPQPLLNNSFPGDDNGLDGKVHLQSVTLEPEFHYFNHERTGGYILAGGGFFHTTTTLTSGTTAFICRRNYPAPCITGQNDFNSNAGGFNVGTGLAWRPAQGSNAKLFLEARYTWVDNKQPISATQYPPAFRRIGYIPLTAGFRY